MSEVKTLYRVDYNVMPDFLDSRNEKITLFIEEFDVVKKTPKGYYFVDKYKKKRWVSAYSRNRYAHTTIDSAIRHFEARTKKRLWYLNKYLDRTKRAEEQIKDFKQKILNPNER